MTNFSLDKIIPSVNNFVAFVVGEIKKKKKDDCFVNLLMVKPMLLVYRELKQLCYFFFSCL